MGPRLLSSHQMVFFVEGGGDGDDAARSLDRAVGILREEAGSALAGVRVEVLVERSSGSWWARPIVAGSNLLRSHTGMEQLLRLPKFAEHRDKLPAAFDMPRPPAIAQLVILDLPQAPDPVQTEVVRRIRDEFASASPVSVSLAKRYLVYEHEAPSSEDDRLVFLVPWRVGEDDPAQTQRYWRDEHGPLAHRLVTEHGHREMKRYEQLQVDRDRADGPFEPRHQGLAMQYVASMEAAVGASVTNLEAMATNTELAIDELNFTQGPSLMFFRNVTPEELTASDE
jgi:hypothetical protein